MAKHTFKDGIEGRACTKGGEWKPLTEFHIMTSSLSGVRGVCKECRKAISKRYRETHREKLREYNRCYQQEHREEIKARRQRYYQQHKTQLKEWYIAYREQNLDAIRKRGRRYQKANREKVREYHREWGAKNIDKVRAYRREAQNRRRARLADAIVEPVDTRVIYERCRHRCVYCGRTEDLTLDHVIPIAKRGPHAEDNLVVACRRCNSEKHTRFLGAGEDCWLPWEWHGSFPYGEIQQRAITS